MRVIFVCVCDYILIIQFSVYCKGSLVIWYPWIGRNSYTACTWKNDLLIEVHLHNYRRRIVSVLMKNVGKIDIKLRHTIVDFKGVAFDCEFTIILCTFQTSQCEWSSCHNALYTCWIHKVCDVDDNFVCDVDDHFVTSTCCTQLENALEYFN